MQEVNLVVQKQLKDSRQSQAGMATYTYHPHSQAFLKYIAITFLFWLFPFWECVLLDIGIKVWLGEGRYAREDLGVELRFIVSYASEVIFYNLVMGTMEFHY